MKTLEAFAASARLACFENQTFNKNIRFKTSKIFEGLYMAFLY